LQLSKRNRKLARQRDRMLYRGGESCALDAIGFQFRQISKQAIRPGYAAQRDRKIIQLDDVDPAVLLKSESAFCHPGRARTELDVTTHQSIGKKREFIPEIGVQEPVLLETEERIGKFQIRRRDLRFVLRDCYVALLQPDLCV